MPALGSTTQQFCIASLCPNRLNMARDEPLTTTFWFPAQELLHCGLLIGFKKICMLLFTGVILLSVGIKNLCSAV
jgi:hypothetical protein